VKSLKLAAALAAALWIPSCSAFAAEAPKITNAQALSMLQALRNLDGRMVIVKETPVMQPWDFGSGTLRLRIAKNVSALVAVEKAIDDARIGIVKEQMKGGVDQIKPGTPEFDAFQKQYADMLNAPAQVELARIRASELKLDKNEIPVTALSALEPILDDDVSPKDAKQ
jgi:nitroreductase